MRHGILAFVFVLAAGLFLDGDLSAGSLEPPGPPAPTMKTLSEIESRTPISSLPFTISLPGSYYLTQNLTGVSGQVGINITSSHVTLDLNGFSLIGVGGSLDGVRSEVVNTRQVAISNGVIRNWGQRGISALNTQQVQVDRLRLDANGSEGVRVGPNSIVRDTTAMGNVGGGISVDTGSSVIGCTATANFGSGIQGATNSLVMNSTASNHNGLVRGNTACGNTSNGIVATNGNRIEENQVIANGVGIRAMGSNNLVVRNSAILNTSEYLVAGGNKLGPISADPATAGPWANFDQ